MPTIPIGPKFEYELEKKKRKKKVKKKKKKKQETKIPEMNPIFRGLGNK